MNKFFLLVAFATVTLQVCQAKSLVKPESSSLQNVKPEERKITFTAFEYKPQIGIFGTKRPDQRGKRDLATLLANAQWQTNSRGDRELVIFPINNQHYTIFGKPKPSQGK